MPDLGQLIGTVLSWIGAFLLEIVVLVLEWARWTGPRPVVAVMLLMVAALMLAALLMQKRLNGRLDAEPDKPVSLWKQEFWFSIPGLLLLPFLLIWLLLKAIVGLFRRKKKDPEKEGDDKGLVVATLGPSFLLAAVITGFIYVAAVLAEPLLRAQLGLSAGYPAWQFVVFGGQPELGWIIPLRQTPWLELLLCTFVWLGIWWWCGRLVRLFAGKSLGRNLIREVDDAGTLAGWRRWWGAERLWEPVASYLKWARWFPLAAIPLLLLAWTAVTAQPYRLDPSLFVVAAILFVSQVLHLWLRGLLRPPAPEEEEPDEEPEVVAHGWVDVLADLGARFQVDEPIACALPRAVPGLPTTDRDAVAEGLISPLLSELLPGERLTWMQRLVLEALSRQAWVHTEPPGEQTITLRTEARRGSEDLSGLRKRNQVVLAPEGAGKSTLALLAACNHPLVHTRGALLVVRHDAQAVACHARLVETVQPSTLRWNLRIRRVGKDLVQDLVQGIVPDILVASLSDLALHILDDDDTFEPFLRSLGLVVVDDVESFCGPVEVHAQLTFRRLQLRLRSLLGLRELGEDSAPLVLALGTDSMHDTATWAQTLCGIDAVHRPFTLDPDDTAIRDASEKLAEGKQASVAFAPKDPVAALAEATKGRHHVFHRLEDFRTAAGERVELRELIECCERLAVPWHFRAAGDARRHLGRSPLLLDSEPRHYTDQVSDACVILLQGEWSAVRRERARLMRAGHRFTRLRGGYEEVGEDSPISEPIAFVVLTDPDQEMAFTEMARSSSITDLIASMPLPLVRPPVGLGLGAHMASELEGRWLEVRDVIDAFGNPAGQILRKLADRRLLLTEERTDVEEDRNRYEHLVYVRVPASAIARSVKALEANPRGGRGAAVLPPRVSQVELVTGDPVTVRDRISYGPVGQVDRAGAWLSHYPGRVFEDASGRFVVVGRASAELAGAQQDLVGEGDVLIDPFLADDISSPRRRISLVAPAQGGREQVRGQIGPDPVLLGRYPVEVAHGPVTIRSRHVATFRLGPVFNEVRQRLVYVGREEQAEQELRTCALRVYPNPSDRVARLAKGAPGLSLRAARVLAAAIRELLPSCYRAAADSLGVGLHVTAQSPTPESELGPQDCLVIFDLEKDGNGASSSIYRDGVEGLLRLARLMLERVLYHDRLRARHDQWGDEDQILAAQDQGGDAEEARQRDQEVRREVLTWLDSRLRPEGGAASLAEVGNYGSGDELGEGDVFDLGRVWYSRDGSVTSLLWAKHRWRLPDGREGALDVGFDRTTFEESRFFTENSGALAAYADIVAEHLANPANSTDDGPWGAPRGARFWNADSESTGLAADDLVSQVGDYHSFASAIAAHTWPAMRPLAEVLRERADVVGEDAGARYELASFVSSFVQGIRYSVPSALRGGLRPPINTLLYKIGDCDSKSLLLALLLKHCGIEAGLFVSMAEGHAVAAVAAPPPVDGVPARDGRPVLETWAAEVGLSDPPTIWAHLPETASSSSRNIYVPVESTARLQVGFFGPREPASWVFLPMTALWVRLHLGSGALPSDAAEFLEER